MTDYRRTYTSGATWFFTVNLAERRGNRLLIEHIQSLREAFAYVRERRPFCVEAVGILPDHLHCLWTLPPGDADYSTRWNLLKGRFSRSIASGERISRSRAKRRERGLWQRRFWEHCIRDEADFNRHVDYIHWNPVKHGWVNQVVDWPYSSFHRFVAEGTYPVDWAGNGKSEINGGE
ncbi:MAG: transposase [Thiotrichales bacterium]